jgi:RNA polymerase sigma-70 factor (ECF subfamily)
VDSAGSTTSLTLLQRAKAKDGQAWERIVELYGPLVYRLCRTSKLQASDSYDLVQDVFQAVFDNLDRFRRDRAGDSFRAWLLTIAKNKIRDRFRAEQRRVRAVGGTDMQRLLQDLPALDWDTSTDGGEFDSGSNLAARAVKLVRGDFEPRTWDAFWMTTVDGRDAIDVAEALGVSKWAVYQSKSRVLRRLRGEMAGFID